TVAREGKGEAVFLPDRLDLSGKMTPEIRKRGIFSIPVYSLALEAKGRFAAPNWTALGIDPADASWKDAYLALSISDTRSIRRMSELAWGGASATFLPGAGALHGGQPGVHAPVTSAPGGDGVFSFTATLNGTQGLYFTPFGKQTEVKLESPWPSPSFQGNWIPVHRTVNAQGFSAEWSIPDLGRDFPQEWPGANTYGQKADSARFGLDLMQSVDSYR